MAVSISAVSKEYLHITVFSDVDLETQTVEFAFLQGTATPDDVTGWLQATWEGIPSTTRAARLLIGPGTVSPLTPGSYTVWVRVTGTTEAPVRSAGSVTIV